MKQAWRAAGEVVGLFVWVVLFAFGFGLVLACVDLAVPAW